jgi:exopolysaccharide production protein ExoY
VSTSRLSQSAMAPGIERVHASMGAARDGAVAEWPRRDVIVRRSAPSGAPASRWDAAPLESWAYVAIKALMDVAGAMVLLVLASVVFCLIALAIKAASPGPVFFVQKRCGRGGRPFRLIKFRTMVADAEALLADPALRARYEPSFKIDDDPRVTRLGRFLRKTSLDELPQLFNVLLGQMSLVGPRPMLDVELEEKYGSQRHTVLLAKPGMTGLWQVSGRSELTYDERVALDVRYVHSRSILLDLLIILKTPVAVLTARGAH